MQKTLVTAPDSYPVTLTEAKDHLRVTTTVSDAYITALINAATESAETYTRRALITQTWDVFIDEFSDTMEMPKGVLQSATITYVDTDGATQTLDTSVYTVDTDSDPGVIRLAYGQSWPSTRDQAHAVTIRIVCGYGAASDVPITIRQAMLIHISHLYESREPVIIGTSVTSVPMSYDSLLLPYRVMRF